MARLFVFLLSTTNKRTCAAARVLEATKETLHYRCRVRGSERSFLVEVLGSVFEGPRQGLWFRMSGIELECRLSSLQFYVWLAWGS